MTCSRAWGTCPRRLGTFVGRAQALKLKMIAYTRIASPHGVDGRLARTNMGANSFNVHMEKITRYKKVSKKKQLQDSEELRDKIAGDPAR